MVLDLDIFRFLDLARLVHDISQLSNAQTLRLHGSGYHWSDLYDTTVLQGSKGPITIPSSSVSLWYQVMCFFVYGAVAWYLYNVLPSEKGLMPWFFVTPQYWKGFFRKSALTPASRETELQEGSNNQPKDRDYVRIENIVKRFRKRPFRDSDDDTIAIRGLTLNIPKGEVFGLLGQNGAGLRNWKISIKGSIQF